jgi:peroxidase
VCDHLQLDAIVRGLVTDRSQVVDPFASADIKHYLHKAKHEHSGSDLIAFNIQRGRDHGLPAYHVYLDFCFGVKAYGWQDLARFIPSQQLNVLRSLYRDFRDIDLYTGGLSEKKFPDASVGPTFACILGIQYYHIKFGDRYFYSHNHQAGSFSVAQLASIQNRFSLGNYLCKTSDYLGEVQKNPFLPVSSYNPQVKCSSLPDLDYNLWKEKY